MDQETAQKQMKDLKAKAKAARRGDNKQAAAAFSAGAKRLQRRLKAAAPKTRRKRGKKSEE